MNFRISLVLPSRICFTPENRNIFAMVQLEYEEYNMESIEVVLDRMTKMSVSSAEHVPSFDMTDVYQKCMHLATSDSVIYASASFFLLGFIALIFIIYRRRRAAHKKACPPAITTRTNVEHAEFMVAAHLPSAAPASGCSLFQRMKHMALAMVLKMLYIVVYMSGRVYYHSLEVYKHVQAYMAKMDHVEVSHRIPHPIPKC